MWPFASMVTSASEEMPGVFDTSMDLDHVLPPSVDPEKNTSGLCAPDVVSPHTTAMAPFAPIAMLGVIDLPGVLDTLTALDQVLPPSVDPANHTSGAVSLPVVSSQTTWMAPSGPTLTSGSLATPGVAVTSAGLFPVFPQSGDGAPKRSSGV